MNVNDMTLHVSSRLDYCDVKHAPARDDKAGEKVRTYALA